MVGTEKEVEKKLEKEVEKVRGWRQGKGPLAHFVARVFVLGH